MLEIIGAIFLTLLLGYVLIGLWTYSYFSFIGFDEVNIPAAIVLFLLGFIPITIWWVIVGSHISLSFK